MAIQIPKKDYLRIKVIPKSAKNEIVEIMEDETIKIRIKALPEKGKANAELIKFLSKHLQMEPEKIVIISGGSEPLKLVKLILK